MDSSLEKDLRNFMDVLPMKGKNAILKNKLVRRTINAYKDGEAKINWDSVEKMNK